MISLAEINDIASRLQVSAETIEKDYAISWILLCLMKSKIIEHFVFYGGTAIKRIYFEDHRFSEDIDLLSANKVTPSVLLDSLHYARDSANLTLTVNRDNIIATRDRIQLLVKYTGYEEIVGSPKEIRLDFAMDMQLFGKVKNNKIIASYSDLYQYDDMLPVMTVNTILANKIRLLIDSTRNEPRDVFDIWFLLHRTDKFDFNIDEVRQIIKEKYGFCPSYSTLRSCLQKPSLKHNWRIRLNKQMACLPEIESVLRDIDLKFQHFFKFK
ncbi:MAG: nucleotidyl transferase AbiEii/AbiGii toxin family protein [Gammaproteobacteria bacterium]